MIKVSQKKNISSMQVIKTFQALMTGDYSMNELIEILNTKESEPVFNNSVISKYINTCRYCGMNILKINNKYYLTKTPFGLDLSVEESQLFKKIQDYVEDTMSKKNVNLINSFVDKLNRFSNKKIAKIEKGNYTMSVELFEKAIGNKCKVKLIFRNDKFIEGIPVSVIQENNKIYFNVYYKRIRKIEMNRIQGVELLDKKYVSIFANEQSVVFRLKGDLAKRYEARENERVTQNPDGTLTVTNDSESKNVLFSRLLRYAEKCEIIQPAMYREDMKNTVNNMLANYELN